MTRPKNRPVHAKAWNLSWWIDEDEILHMEADLKYNSDKVTASGNTMISTTGGFLDLQPGRPELFQVYVMMPKDEAGPPIHQLLREILRRNPPEEHREVISMILDAYEGYRKGLLSYHRDLKVNKATTPLTFGRPTNAPNPDGDILPQPEPIEEEEEE
jgi:hypothetical protein